MSGNALLFQCSKLLVPGLIEYITTVVPILNDEVLSETQLLVMGEIWKGLFSFCSSVRETQRK